MKDDKEMNTGMRNSVNFNDIVQNTVYDQVFEKIKHEMDMKIVIKLVEMGFIPPQEYWSELKCPIELDDLDCAELKMVVYTWENVDVVTLAWEVTRDFIVDRTKEYYFVTGRALPKASCVVPVVMRGV